MKRLALTLLVMLTTLVGMASNEVSWTYKITGDNTPNPVLEMTATVKPGFHMYSQDNPEAGGVPLTFNFDLKGCVLDGKTKASKNYTKEYDDIMETDVHFYTGTVTFRQKLKPTAEKWNASVEIGGQVCDDSGCFRIVEGHAYKGTAPVTEEMKKEAALLEQEAAASDSIPADSVAAAAPAAIGDGDHSQWWSNVEAEMKAFEDTPEQSERSLWYIFIAGFIGGLIALVTPCVWPMIPMTVSFFLKQNKDKSKGIKSAMVYGASIILIYVALGLIVTAIFGASALNELATSAGFNIAFFILLVIFAISFMGGFELTLPSKWTNKMDSKVDSTTGYLSLFFMAFTLCLVSFSCTGPIIGTLLVEAAASSNFISPAIGMFGFALALALPFTLFAIFPTWLKSMPKSGGWMNTVKVVLGFLELALALKFLSVADMAYGWGILPRWLFLLLWIIIFFAMGVFLVWKIWEVNKVRMALRIILIALSWGFTAYLVPGLWGAPVKAVSAFAPPMPIEDREVFYDYEEGLAYAKQEGKPVLLDFTGYGCVNCRKMEAYVLSDETVKERLKAYVLIELYVDDKNDGIGEKNSKIQREIYGANAQPYYIQLDKNGQKISQPYAFSIDPQEFLDWLQY